jgi:hypothetical protein
MTIFKKSSAIALSTVAAALLTFSGCGGGGSSSSTTTDPVTDPVTVPDTTSDVVTLSGTLTGDMTLDATKVYELDGKVNFTGGTLTIPAGTTIYGATPASYLAINRGAKIDAVGTKAEPIVFTSKLDYDGQSYDNAQGEWGGLVLLGNAYTNLGEQTYEAGDQPFGSATHDNDGESSGHLEYVVVKHTGFEVEQDKELNGLSLGGVGSGTIIKNVAIVGGADDGIEFWGGTVNVEGLYIYNASDDSLDTDLGYSGTVTNVLAQQFIVDKDTFDSSTMETGNDKILINNSDDITKTHVINGTFYAVGGGLYMKNDAGMTFDNVKVVLNNPITPTQAIVEHRTQDVYDTNKMFAVNTGICLKNEVSASALYATTNSKDEGQTAYDFWNTDKMVQDASNTPGNLNVHEDDATSCGGADEAAIWKGKAGSNDPLEVPTKDANIEVLSGTLSGDMTLDATKVYELDGKVNFTNGTLTIPAGTTIYGATPSSYLAINRGAMINAKGTIDKPIVFTSKADYEGKSHDDAQGEWGGLVLLGNAYTNLGEQTYEAGDQPFGSATHDNDGESSGDLEYVVVKHTGFEVEQDKELNGLSLGGVGSGTTIKNVAIIGGADDGIEFWGGTVNVEGLYIYNASDDSLDTDLGYSGTVTNVLAQQKIVDKDTFDSSTMETGNDKILINNSDDITKTHVINGTFYAVGGGLYMKNDAGMTFDNVKVVLDNTVTPTQAIVEHRTQDVYDTNKMFAVNTGICLKNLQDNTALYATTNSKDEGKTAFDFWSTDMMVQDASNTPGNLNVHEDDETTCAGADEATVWKGKAGSYDPLEQ